VNESPEKVYGRLSEAVHISGYSLERACNEFKWLLEDNRWKQCSNGFEHIDDFLSTVNFGEFKISIEQRKEISKKLTDLRATQRAIGGALGVSHQTVHRDLEHGTHVPKNVNEIDEYKELREHHGTHVPNTPPIITQSGEEINKAAQRTLSKDIVIGSSNTNAWNTPSIIIDKTIELMGSIDLDPCSDSYTNPNVPAERHFTIDDDGLNQPWHGRVYMNPPYGNEIGNWTGKLKNEYEMGRTTQAVALVPSRTDTEWFRGLCKYPRCFIWGRLRFSEYENSAPFPSMIVYFGSDITKFTSVFGDIGDVYVHVKNGQ